MAMEKQADFVVDQILNMASGRFDVEPADERTHPHVSWKAYRRFQQEAESHGFRHLADVDVVSIEPAAQVMRRTALAMFSGPDGTEVMGHYRMSLRWTVGGMIARMMRGGGSFIEIGTYFGSSADGVELETARAAAELVWDLPDFHRRELMAPKTPLDAVIERHRQRVRQYATGQPGMRPLVMTSVDDIVRHNRVVEQRKRDWRRERGWVTRDELARLSRLSGPPLDRFFEAVQRVASQHA